MILIISLLQLLFIVIITLSCTLVLKTVKNSSWFCFRKIEKKIFRLRGFLFFGICSFRRVDATRQNRCKHSWNILKKKKSGVSFSQKLKDLENSTFEFKFHWHPSLLFESLHPFIYATFEIVWDSTMVQNRHCKMMAIFVNTKSRCKYKNFISDPSLWLCADVCGMSFKSS